jgi:ABC-type branched-subunit amino acid transport system permease subunit
MIDFSPLEPFMDELFLNVILVVVLPAFVGVAIGILLTKLRIPKLSSGTIASLVTIALAYKMLMNVIS